MIRRCKVVEIISILLIILLLVTISAAYNDLLSYEIIISSTLLIRDLLFKYFCSSFYYLKFDPLARSVQRTISSSLYA